MNPEYSAVSLCFYIIGFCRKAFLLYIATYIIWAEPRIIQYSLTNRVSLVMIWLGDNWQIQIYETPDIFSPCLCFYIFL